MRQALQAAPQALAERLGSQAKIRRLTGDIGAEVPAGALAWPESGVWLIETADGTSRLLVWAHGLTLYQAVVRGGANTAEVAQRFFHGLSHTQH